MANDKCNDKKYHVVYKTTNKKTKRIYIGVHSTDNLNDGYMGSGTWVRYALKKYGLHNFDREILFNFRSRCEALKKEKEIVTKKFIIENEVYNIALGGGGQTVVKKVIIPKIIEKEIERLSNNIFIKCAIDYDVYNRQIKAGRDYYNRHTNGETQTIALTLISFVEKNMNNVTVELEELLNNKSTHDIGVNAYKRLKKNIPISIRL